MCGIAGFLDRSQRVGTEDFAAILQRMTDVMTHRGPDDEGAWVDTSARVALGHRRLSIVDLSREGHQPMFSPDKRLALVFNGEIYNFLEIRRELQQAGFVFRGHSDTEVMLAAFCRWGVEPAVQRFNGMFAFALWDHDQRTLWLARDRFGKKPLYYSWIKRTLLFGSELKALSVYPDFPGEIDHRAVALYLRFGYIPAPYSIYRGVAKLPPGTLLSIGPSEYGNDIEPLPYWSAQQMVQQGIDHRFRGSYNEAVDELERLLCDAVKLRMVADVPVGAFLSGGIDSSLIVALMQSVSDTPARTFSIGFSAPGHDEAEHARAVAKHLKSDHTELYATEQEAKDVIPMLPSMFDEPFGDCSAIPTYLVARLTRNQVTVSLSGDGGDELFAGYDVYFSNQRFHQKYGRLPRALRKTLGVSLRPFSAYRFERFGDVIGFGCGEEIHHSLCSIWHKPSRLVRGTAEPPTAFTDRARYIDSAQFIEQMMYLDAVSYLPDDILAKVDRASMAVSLEARCPLLDFRVFEFAWTLPLEMKVENRVCGKRILRDVLYRHVPRELVDRQKMGFHPPVGDWMRGPLRPWAEELLSERRFRNDGLIEPGPVRRKWQAHLAGSNDGDLALWVVLMLQAWLSERRTKADPDKSQPFAARMFQS